MRNRTEEDRYYYESDEPIKIKGRISGFLGAVLTVLYAVYIVSYFGETSMNSLGGSLATMFVMPHLICVAVAAAFSIVGFFAKKRWAMMTSGIMMAVAAAVFPMYAGFVIVQAVLLFVSYARMGIKY